MEYVNFNVSIPVDMYLKIDLNSKKLNMSKNEFILYAIFHSLASRTNAFRGIKNAGFHTSYNGLME